MAEGRIDLTRVIVGGLLAGAILNFGEFLINGLILSTEWTILLDQLNLPPFNSQGMVVFVLLTFVVGMILVALYVAAVSLFRRRTSAALAAGVVIWFLVYLYPVAWMAALNLIPYRIVAILVFWGLGEAVLAAMLGAAVYEYRSIR